MDPPTARLARQLPDEPRLHPGRTLPPVRALVHGAALARRVVTAAARAWRDPDTARRRFQEAVQEALRLLDDALAAAKAGDPWTGAQTMVEAVPRLNRFFAAVLLPKGFSLVLAGWIPFFGILQRQARRAAPALGEPSHARLFLEITRGLPYNVTTEMDLALWDIARRLREDPEAAAWLRDHPAEALAAAWRQREPAQAARAALVAREAIRQRRAVAAREAGRRRLPRLLLSNGTAFYEAPPGAPAETAVR